MKHRLLLVWCIGWVAFIADDVPLDFLSVARL